MLSWLSIVKKELQLIFEDKSILLTCLVAPILYAFFVGSIYSNKEVSEIPVAVVDYDHTGLSRKTSNLIGTNEKIKITGHYSSLEGAMTSYNNLEVQGIIIIPKQFEKRTMNLDGSVIELILNNTKFLTSNEINKGVQQVVLTISGGVRMQFLISQKVPLELAKQQAQPIIPVIKSIYNATNNYGDYLLPILLILILQQTLIIGFGQSMVHEFRHGLLQNLNEVSSLNFLKIISAKSIYYFILYASYFFIFYTIIFPFYNLSLRGPMISLFLVSSIFIVAILLYTIFFASLFKTTIGWTEVLAFSTYPLFLISGYSWPIDAMPKIMQLIANLLPTTPYYKLFSNLSHSGTNIEHNATSFIHLLSLLILGYLALYLRFAFMRRKKLNQISKP